MFAINLDLKNIELQLVRSYTNKIKQQKTIFVVHTSGI